MMLADGQHAADLAGEGHATADELALALDFDVRLQRLMSGLSPFGRGELVPELSEDLIDIAELLRELARARAETAAK